MTISLGHGHVRPRPDGAKARCGGPGICAECSKELAKYQQEDPSKPVGDTAEMFPKTMARIEERMVLGVLSEAVRTWGVEAQLRMLQEECAELIAAVNRFDRGRVGTSDLAEEIADVEIMCAQARLIIGDRDVEVARQRKLRRLARRLAMAELGTSTAPADEEQRNG